MWNTNGSSRRAILVEMTVLLALLGGSALISLAAPGLDNQHVWRAEQVLIKAADQAGFASPTQNDDDWAAVGVDEIGPVDQVTWIRTWVDLAIGETTLPPYAVFVSGPFSAQVFWDGQLLGDKGQPGSSPAEESPGPIDAVLYVSEDLSTAGSHLLALRVSANHIGYQAQSLFHALFLGHFESDPRREFRYYALPLLLSGGLFLLALQFARLAVSTGSQSSLLLSVAASALLCQMGSEVSRSVVNYAYDWHLLRSLLIWGFAVMAAAMINALVVVRLHHPRIRLLSWLTIALVAVVSYLSSGFDEKAVNALQVLAIPPLLAALYTAFQPSPDRLLLAAGLLSGCWLLLANLAPGVFLDRGFFLTFVVYLTAVWFWLSRGAESMDREPPSDMAPAHFFVKHTGRGERVLASSVLLLKAAGNYTEMICDDGRTLLHHQRLGQIMESPPAGFLRVHRSHAVNVDRVRSLRSRAGSRYQVELDGGVTAPVSRFQVKSLRDLLQSAPPAPSKS